MKTFTITISAKTESGVINSIEEAKKSIENGNRSGFDSNEDEEYSFESSGNYEEEEKE